LAQSDIPRADAVLAEALDAARATGDRRLEALAGTRRVFVRLLLDPQVSQTRSLHEAERWVAAFEEVGDESGLAEAWRVVGVIRFWQGQAGVAEENLERAMQHARRAKNARQEAEILRWLPIVILQGPAPADEAIARLTSLLDRAGGDRRVEVAVIRVRAELEAMQGRFDVARDLIEHVRTLALELGDQVALTAVLRHAGYLEILDGDPVAAESHLRTAYEILERIRDFGHLASHAPDLAGALYSQGRYEEALHFTEVAEGITIGGDVDAEIRWRQVRARILARLGRADEAESLAREGLELASATDYLELNAVALASLAEVLRLAGRDQEAAASLQEANRLYERKGNLVMADRTRAELQELSGG
jgi:tetratricopeptide (TPR) repeat protein